jgi:hypothetical protein
VRMVQSRSSVFSRRIAIPLFVGILSLSLPGCGLFPKRDSQGGGSNLPLSVQLRPAPTVAGAQIRYQDACGQPRILPIGDLLAEAIHRKAGSVFQKVVTQGGETAPVDGYQDVSAGLIQLDLVIPRKADQSYPATLSIGLDYAYTDAGGTVLHRQTSQSIGRGNVDVTNASCEVKGLDRIARQAVENVTEEMAKQLGTSSRIVEAAAARKAGTVRATAGTAPPPSPLGGSGPSAGHAAPPNSPPPAPGPATATRDEQAILGFRAIIRDESRDQLLQAGEKISIEMEVKNEGPGAVSGVEVLVSGTPDLVEEIPAVLPVGDIPPGEFKRISVDGKIGTVKEPLQAELMLTLRTSSLSVQLPNSKKFLVAMRPAAAPAAATAPVDVDRIPKIAAKLKQPKAVGVAIGIGKFREEGVPRVKYAARDAGVVADYWSAVGGIPPERVRRLIDSHALKRDLAEAFEEWLPKQVDPASVVYVYVSGRGTVDPATGAVSVIPFDGTAMSGRVYSLRRLHETLVKLPIERAIVLLDLSLEHSREKEGGDQAAPVWEQEGQGKDKIMWMVGNRAVQEAHGYDQGQHGLFTYQLLRGLAGEADLDEDGTILAGELCTYAKGQVVKIAREQFGNEQEPLCIPGPGQGAIVRVQPLAKLEEP